MKPFAPMCARRGGEHAFSEMGSRVLSDRMRWRLQADHGWKHDTGDEIVTRGIDTEPPIMEAKRRNLVDNTRTLAGDCRVPLERARCGRPSGGSRKPASRPTDRLYF